MITELFLQLKIFAAGCDNSFFGFPTWHKYLDEVNSPGYACTKKLNSLNDIWLIALALAEILLRVVIVIAIIYVLVGGFKYMTSRANPDKTQAAKNTVLDALIGLVIAIVATAVIAFVAGRFKG